MALRTVDYIDILNGSADLCGLDRDNLATTEFKELRQSHDRRLQTAWEADMWPELLRTEKRYYKPLWAGGTTYSVPTATTVSEVWFPAAKGHYQALVAMPVAVTSITRVTTTATVTTTAAHSLITGDQVTITGADQSQYNITATITVTGASTFTYTIASDPGANASGTLLCSPNPANASDVTTLGYWAPSATSYSGNDWSSTETNTRGDIRYWPATDRHYIYHNLSDSSGNEPTTATHWAILTDLDRYIAYAQSGETAIGSVLEVCDNNPRNSTRLQPRNWFLSDNGVQVLTPSGSSWITYRIRTIRLTGENFSSTTTYAAGNQVYYSASGTPGNFYDCILAPTSNQLPTDTTYWTKVDVPLIFQRYLEFGAYADYLRNNGQQEKADAAEAMAARELSDQQCLLVGLQGQRKRTLVVTR